MKRILLVLMLAFVGAGSVFSQSKKSVSILGDSYSTFERFVEPDTNYVWYGIPPRPHTDVSAVDQTWWHRFIEENDYRLCVNNSFSGSTICNTGYRGEDYSDRSFITRMNRLGSPDVIFIFGGTNDAWADAPVGEYQYGGWTPEDLYAFRPAMAHMLDYMIARYPNVEIYFLLNPDLKEEINESVRTVCSHYRIACIELRDIDKKGNHPSVRGMKQISEQVKAYIDKRPAGR